MPDAIFAPTKGQIPFIPSGFKDPEVLIDQQTFGDRGQWPVVASVPPEPGPPPITRSYYEIRNGGVYAVRELGDDGQTEVYDRACLAFPEWLTDLDALPVSNRSRGTVVYTNPAENVTESGTYDYVNLVWTEAAGRVFWEETYTENYGAGDVQYKRLHIYDAAGRELYFLDYFWGPNRIVKMVVRAK